MSDVKSDFEKWWHDEGSKPPQKEKCEYERSNGECFVCLGDTCVNPDTDWEAHCKKMCEIAWSNGVFCATKRVRGVLKNEQG